MAPPDPVSLHLLSLATDMTRASFGSEDLDLARSLLQLTTAYFLGGDIFKAFDAAEEAHAIYKARLGDDHPSTRDSWRNVELVRKFKESVERQTPRGQGASALQPGASVMRLSASGAAAASAANGSRSRNGVSAAAVNGNVNGTVTSEPPSRIGERGHLDLDELVKYIQGASPAKANSGSGRSNKGLRGKRRTGAKR
jgi:protein TIF31